MVTRRNRNYNATTNTYDESTETTYVGRTLKVYSEPTRVMFSVWGTGVYATCWDDAKNAPVNVMVDIFEWARNPFNYAEEDAPADIVAKYDAFEKARIAKEEAKKREDEARTVNRGKMVVVVRGKKVPLGTTGEVFWIGDDKFNRYGKRIGMKDSSGVVYWTSMKNVEVVRA